jgi:hypothetical protein
MTDAGQLAGGGATQQIMGDRSNAAGWSLTVSKSTGIVVFTLHDGTLSITATHETDIRGGTHSIACVRDRGAGQIYVVIDGVEGTRVLDVVSASIPATVNAAMLGSQPNGSNPVATGVEFRHAAFDRKVVATGDMLTSSTRKRTLEQVVGFRVGEYPASSPVTRASCKFYVAQFTDPLRGVTGDAFKKFGPLRYPLEVGQAAPGIVSLVDGLHLPAISTSRSILVNYDPAVGYFYQARYHGADTGSGATYQTGGAVNTLDFLQNSGLFTLLLTLRIDSASAFSQYLFHNNAGSGSTNPGFYLIYNTGNKLSFMLADGAARLTGTNTSTKSFAVGTWYTVAMIGNGPGNPVQMKWAQWPGGRVVPASLTTETWGNITAGVKAAASTQKLILSGRDNTTQCARWSFKEIAAFDAVLSDAEILGHMANAFYEPPGTIAARRERGRMPQGFRPRMPMWLVGR